MPVGHSDPDPSNVILFTKKNYTWICKPNKIHSHISFTRNFFQVNEITSWDFILVQLLIVEYESKFEVFQIEWYEQDKWLTNVNCYLCFNWLLQLWKKKDIGREGSKIALFFSKNTTTTEGGGGRDIYIECSKRFKWNSYFYVSGQSLPFWAALKLL